MYDYNFALTYLADLQKDAESGDALDRYFFNGAVYMAGLIFDYDTSDIHRDLKTFRGAATQKKVGYLVAMTWSGAEYYDGNEELEYGEPYTDWVYRVGEWVLNWRKNEPLIAINEETGERKNLTDLIMGGEIYDSLYYLKQDAEWLSEDSWTIKTTIKDASKKATQHTAAVEYLGEEDYRKISEDALEAYDLNAISVVIDGEYYWFEVEDCAFMEAYGIDCSSLERDIQEYMSNLGYKDLLTLGSKKTATRTATRNFTYAEQQSLQDESLGDMARNRHKLKTVDDDEADASAMFM